MEELKVGLDSKIVNRLLSFVEHSINCLISVIEDLHWQVVKEEVLLAKSTIRQKEDMMKISTLLQRMSINENRFKLDKKGEIIYYSVRMY